MLLLAIRFIAALLPMLFFLKGFKAKVLINKRILLICLVQPVANVIAQTYAASAADAALIAYLTALCPLTMYLAGRIFMKETAPPQFFIFMAVSVAGAILSASAKGQVERISIAGVLWIISSLVFRGLYSVQAKKGQAFFSPAEITISQMFWGAVVFGVASILAGEIFDAPRLLRSLGIWDIAAIGYLSLGSLALAYGFNNFVLGNLSVTMSGMLNNLTFVSTLASGFVLGEPIGWQGLAGSALIVFGVYFSARSKADYEPKISDAARKKLLG